MTTQRGIEKSVLCETADLCKGTETFLALLRGGHCELARWYHVTLSPPLAGRVVLPAPRLGRERVARRPSGGVRWPRKSSHPRGSGWPSPRPRHISFDALPKAPIQLTLRTPPQLTDDNVFFREHDERLSYAVETCLTSVGHTARSVGHICPTPGHQKGHHWQHKMGADVSVGRMHNDSQNVVATMRPPTRLCGLPRGCQSPLSQGQTQDSAEHGQRGKLNASPVHNRTEHRRDITCLHVQRTQTCASCFVAKELTSEQTACVMNTIGRCHTHRYSLQGVMQFCFYQTLCLELRQ